MSTWADCKNILCVRLDNMGDILMSQPAICALKETFNCKITLLTSSMGKTIVSAIAAIDEIIIYDVPWVKSNVEADPEDFQKIIGTLREKQFDGAVIFTVFSQNPQPAALLTYLAGIPRRLAYCRENPYNLLTDWIPDDEPYLKIKHQVRRDLDLVKHIGAVTKDERICIRLPHDVWRDAQFKLQEAGVEIYAPWIIFHPGVSDEKRKYPEEHWTTAGKKIVNNLHYQIIITGSLSEWDLAETIKMGIGKNAVNVAGLLSLEEFIMLIYHATLVVSVNTCTIHIAAATETKLIVLYALTNPQHTPWKGTGKILPFNHDKQYNSSNVVLKHVYDNHFKNKSKVQPDDIVFAVKEILIDNVCEPIPELILPKEMSEQDALIRG